jgi:hypothetical protein
MMRCFCFSSGLHPQSGVRDERLSLPHAAKVISKAGNQV